MNTLSRTYLLPFITILTLIALLIAATRTQAQSPPAVDCNCVLKLPALRTNACQAFVPDLCLLATNCFSTNVTIGSPGYCGQTPAPGTPVGPGTTYITFTVVDNLGTASQCVVPFVVTPVQGCLFTLICATNKTVQCGSAWNFNLPTWTNACSPPPGTPSNGVALTVVGTVTNGTCPQVITRTWQGVDDCGYHDQCSQTVTVVDTIPPVLNCVCVTNSAAFPVTMTVQACSGVIPNLCFPAMTCAFDACGVVGCSQSPPPGTTVGIGIFPVTVTVYDCASNAASCVFNYTVIQPPGGCAFTLLCSSNKTVECGTAWTFNPPTWTNACSPPPGTPSNGVVVTVISTVTNGTCPKVITRTWKGVDDCGNIAQCSQTVTVVDTTPPFLDCNCLRNPAGVQLSVVACTSTIPDLCLLANSCASDNCGPLQCWQSPAAGTPVGPGSYPITVMVTDCASNSAFCVLSYTVTPPPGGCSTNPCPPTLAAVLNTGTTNGNGGLLPTGAPEQVWVNIAAPAGPTPMVVADPTIWPIVTGPWIAPNTTSAWVSPSVNNYGLPGWYTNRVIYNAPCTNVCLRGRIASDDDGYFYVNGALVSQSGFTAWSNINDCVDFVAGPNVIDFVVHNAGGPTGFRTELEFWTQCCTNTNCVVTINCPGSTNITTCNPAGVVVTYPLPQASSTCGVITNIVCTPPSGSGFPIGTTTVTCTAYDSLGNSATCTFTVTVSPAPPPYVICPPLNLSVTGCPPVMPDLTSMVGIITNCPTNCAFTITQTIAAGTILSPGIHVVIVRTCDCQNHCRDCDVIVHAVQTPNCCTLVALPRLFSGATNGPAGLLPGGALDPHFTTGAPLFTTPNPYVPAWIHWLWVPNSALSQWVGPAPSYAASAGGVYLYTNRFFLCSTNQASLMGRWTADDTGAIWLNGNITTAVLPPSWAFTNWHPVNITSGFAPGWNELVFRVTNASASVTGLRTEIFGTNCCNSCVTIACPNDIVTNTCANGVVVNYNFPFANSACAKLASVVCTPPPGSFFPVGTTVVTCTAIDTLGNAATCTFKVIVQRIGKPVVLKCPPNQIIYTCGSNAVAYYAPFVSGNVGPVICTPPSGSTFPLGTNIVTCTATNACGAGQSCYFLVIVKPYPLGPPLIFTAGLPDNYALPIEPSPQTACMVTAFSGYPIWKGFDATGINDLLGHHFAGLPNNIIQAQLIIRMKPGPDEGSDNDGLFMGLPSCSFSSFIFGASIKTLPGAVPPTGGTWKTPPNGSTTFTLNLNPALIAYMNSAQVLDVVIHDDTTVDYMQLRLWTCPPPYINNGVPHWTTAIAGPPSTIASTAQPELDPFGPIGNGPAVSVSPPNGDVSQPNSVEVGLGGGQGFSFTTILDMNAPVGSQIIISTPTSDGSNAPVLKLAKSCQPNCGWDVIKMKRADTGTTSSRISAVNSDGNLLDSFVEPEDLGVSEPPLSLHPEDGITQFPVSLLLEPSTGTITLTFPGTTARRLCNGLPCPRGWDGTIKGRLAGGGGRKGWDGTIRCPCFDEEASRVVFTPIGTYTPGPFASLQVRSFGLTELVLAGEQLITMGGHIVRPDLSSQDSLSTFQGTDAGDGVSWSSMADGSGISVDLGRSQSFDVGIHHFENGDIPTEEQLFRIHTNRPTPSTGPTYPPPPPIEFRLANGPTGVDCSVDFTTLGAVSVTANLYSNGVLIAYGSIDGPLITPDDPLTFDHWPERLGALPGTGVLRVTSRDQFNIQGFLCDEVQFVPGLPTGAPPIPYYGELQALGSAGLDSMLHSLQRVPACAPATLNITPMPSGAVLTWSGIGYRLVGAETLDGPWIDLGVASPVVLPPNSIQRYFRLVCD